MFPTLPTPTPDFYPRPPRGGRHDSPFIVAFTSIISTHALREEGDEELTIKELVGKLISTHALREEGDPVSAQRYRPGYRNFYPRPPRGGRQERLDMRKEYCNISTHALREEGDPKNWPSTGGGQNFYPRPPRGGRRQVHRQVSPAFYFYPRPPRGGRQAKYKDGVMIQPISTHALREEGDFPIPKSTSKAKRFLPTPSARRATTAQAALRATLIISTHALREEGDHP